jgi:hypothetical protein
MATGRRIALNVGVALLVATAALFPHGAARAQSCNAQDLWNALQNVGSGISSPACDTTYADPVGDSALIALAATLGGVMAEDPSANVCGAIQNAFNDLTNGQSDLGSLNSALSGLGLATSALDTIQQFLSGAANPLAAAECACQWDQGVGALGADVVACIQGALCDLDAAIGSPCHCTPPPPTLANCTPPIDTCTDYGTVDPSKRPECQNAIYGNTNKGYVPVVETPEANGTLVTLGADSNCAGDMYCFCPSPMSVVAVPNAFANGGNENNGYVMYVCECPKGTKPAGTSGALAEVCICDDTGLPAVPTVKTTTNPDASACPPSLTGKSCATGQVNYFGKCITPCSNPSEGLTLDGGCCDPTQVTSCGQCCPPGTTPNPATGSCEPAPVNQ